MERGTWKDIFTKSNFKNCAGTFGSSEAKLTLIMVVKSPPLVMFSSSSTALPEDCHRSKSMHWSNANKTSTESGHFTKNLRESKVQQSTNLSLFQHQLSRLSFFAKLA